MRVRHWWWVVCLGWGVALGETSIPDARVDTAALESIRAEDLKSIVTFLASDELDGRETGSTANRIATAYLAHRFEAIGLEPAGDHGSWFQNFGLLQAKLGASNRLEFSRGPEKRELQLMEEFYPSRLSSVGSASGPVTFAGFGISVPRLGYDDYAGLDLTGSVALIFSGEPGGRGDEEESSQWKLDDEAQPINKILNAQGRGAVGVILFRPSKHGMRTGFRARNQWPEDPSQSPLMLEADSDLVKIPVAVVSVEAVESYFDKSPDDIRQAIEKEKRPASRRLELQATLNVDFETSRTETRNVLARWRGGDPRLKDEYILVGAHLDHIGESGGKIFNGADDDASGTAAVLEVAEAFSRASVRPPRSILFCLWNGEERGLLGSRYFIRRPAVPLKQIKAVLQADMIGRNQEIPEKGDYRFGGLPAQSASQNADTLHLVGYSRCAGLASLMAQANRNVGLRLLEELDDHPLQLIRRSDSWSFLAQGIPALLLTTGLHPDYHTTDDDADRLNYPKLARISRLIYLSANDAAGGADMIGGMTP